MKLITTLLLIFISHLGFSQEWRLIESNENIKIFSSELKFKDLKNGMDHQRLIFKYENLTDQPVDLSFKREVNYGDVTSVQERDFSLTIPAHSILEYDDSKMYDQTYYLFSKDNQGFIKKSLKEFKIINTTTK